MAEANPSGGYFSMGLETLKVPIEMFAENRRRLCQQLKTIAGIQIKSFCQIRRDTTFIFTLWTCQCFLLHSWDLGTRLKINIWFLEVESGSIVLLQGGGDQGRCEGDSSDVGPIFRQESYFHWCFGVLEPDYYGAIDVDTGRWNTC